MTAFDRAWSTSPRPRLPKAFAVGSEPSRRTTGAIGSRVQLFLTDVLVRRSFGQPQHLAMVGLVATVAAVFLISSVRNGATIWNRMP